MINYYKIVDTNYIIAIGTHGNDRVEEITESEYNTIMQMIQNSPTNPEGYSYKLRAENLEWELVELPPMPEDEDIDDAEALNIILGGGAE